MNRSCRWLGEWVSEQCFTSPPTQYRSYGRRFLQVKRPNQQHQSTEGTFSTQRNQTYNIQTINTKHSKSPTGWLGNVLASYRSRHRIVTEGTPDRSENSSLWDGLSARSTLTVITMSVLNFPVHNTLVVLNLGDFVLICPKINVKCNTRERELNTTET